LFAAFLFAASSEPPVLFARESGGSWKDDIESANWFERRKAVRSVGDSRPLDVEAIPFLIERLKDEKAEVRMEAARVVGMFGVKAAAAIDPLLEALKDSDPDVRFLAGRSLTAMGPLDRRVLTEMLRRIDNSDQAQANNAIEAVCAADDAAGGLIEEAFRSEEPALRLFALKFVSRKKIFTSELSDEYRRLLKEPNLVLAREAFITLCNAASKSIGAVRLLRALVSEENFQFAEEASRWLSDFEKKVAEITAIIENGGGLLQSNYPGYSSALIEVISKKDHRRSSLIYLALEADIVPEELWRLSLEEVKKVEIPDFYAWVRVLERFKAEIDESEMEHLAETLLGVYEGSSDSAKKAILYALPSLGYWKKSLDESLISPYLAEKGNLRKLGLEFLKKPAMRNVLFACKGDPSVGKRQAVAEVLFEIAPYSDDEIDALFQWLDDVDMTVKVNVLACIEFKSPHDRVRSRLEKKLETSDPWLKSRIGRILEKGERK